MIWTYAVTLERASGVPLTSRGTLDAGTPSKAASMAIRAARREFPKIHYDSIAIVIIKEEE